MEDRNIEKQFLGTWELKDGPVITLEKDRKMTVKGDPTGQHTYHLEEEGDTLLLTMPGLLSRSEVVSLTPTELVVKEFEEGSSESTLRSFRKMPD
jgi:hypothetical protein